MSNRPYTVLKIPKNEKASKQLAYQAFDDPGGIIHTMSEYRFSGNGGFTNILDVQNTSGVLFIFGSAFLRVVGDEQEVGLRIIADGIEVIDRRLFLAPGTPTSRSFLAVGAMMWGNYRSGGTDSLIMDMRPQPLHFDDSLKLDVYAGSGANVIAFEKHYRT